MNNKYEYRNNRYIVCAYFSMPLSLSNLKLLKLIHRELNNYKISVRDGVSAMINKIKENDPLYQRLQEKVKQRRTTNQARRNNVLSFPRTSHKPASCDFYSSRKWRSLRYEVLKQHGRRCCCCGSTPSDGIRLHVDHIKPRSIFPELQYEYSNLQVLCEDCNIGKSNNHTDDWREAVGGQTKPQ